MILIFSFSVKLSAQVIGVNWTMRNTPANISWQSVTYGNGTFVAVAGSGTGNRVMTSIDGITWTSRTSAENNGWQTVTYGNGLFVAVANSGTHRVMTSPDGITWTAQTSPLNMWQSVTFGKGMFVAVAGTGGGDQIMISNDGVNWTTITAPTAKFWKSIVYGNNMFVAVANNGSTTQIMTSIDGRNWESQTSPGNSSIWSSITYGNGKFVAISNSGTADAAMYSSDGVTWTRCSGIVRNNWITVAFGAGKFVALANDGNQDYLMYSTDGITWTNSAPAQDRLWSHIAFGGGMFVALNIDGGAQHVMTSGSITTAAPVITNFSPTSGLAGEKIKIVGSNFIGITSLQIGGVQVASYLVENDSTIYAVAGSGNTGVVGIAGRNGEAVSSQSFTFATAPSISYQTPKKYLINNTIQSLSPSNTGGAIQNDMLTVSTFLGDTSSIDNNVLYQEGVGSAANFYYPTSFVKGNNNNLYVIDFSNHLIREINLTTRQSTLFAGNTSINTIVDGIGSAAGFEMPKSMTSDGSNLYVVDMQSIRKIDIATKEVSTIINGQLGAYTKTVHGIAYYDNSLYVSDNVNNDIKRIDLATNTINVFAGSSTSGNVNGVGVEAKFDLPTDIVSDNKGSLYVVDRNNYSIRKINVATAEVTTIAGSGNSNQTDGIGLAAEFVKPFDLTIDEAGEHLYVTDNVRMIRRINLANNQVKTIVNPSNTRGFKDGNGATATMYYLLGLYYNKGYLYAGDNSVIRKIATTPGYSIYPKLPSGMHFNDTTGVIYGTPTETSVATNYTVSGYNVAGSSTTTVNIEVINIPPPSGLVYATPTDTLTYKVTGGSGVPTINTNGHPVTYSISGVTPQGITINSETGEITYGNNVLGGANTIKVKACNDGGCDSTTKIVYINGFAPKDLVYSKAIDTVYFGQKGQSVIPTLDEGGYKAGIIFDEQPPVGFHISKLNGTIFYDSTLAVGTYTVKVVATNWKGNTKTSYTVVVLPRAPKDFAYSPSSAQYPYTYNYNSPLPTINTGGLVKYKLVNGVNGIVVDSVTGQINKPIRTTPVGFHTIKVVAYNPAGSDTADFVLEVIGMPHSFTYNGQWDTLAIGQSGFSKVPTLEDGGVPVKFTINYAYTHSRVNHYTITKDQVSIDSVTGKISYHGNLAIDTYDVEVVATSTVSNFIEIHALVVTIAKPSEFAYSPTSDTVAYKQAGKSNAPTVNNGGGSVTYALSENQVLPSGITINPETGVITYDNTVKVGNYNVVVKACNAQGCDSTVYHLVVKAFIPSNYAYEPNTKTTDYRVAGTTNTPAGNNGGGEVTFEIQGDLHNGFTIDSLTGAITYDTILPVGEYPLTVIVKNNAGQTTTNYTVIVAPTAPKNFAYSPAKDTTLYTNSGKSKAPKGNTGGIPVKYSIVNTTPGITIDSLTGVISFTNKLAAMTYSVNVKVKNEVGSTNTTFTLVVSPIDPNISYTPAVDTMIYQGTGKTVNVVLFDGGAPTSFEKVSGFVNGITLNIETGAITYDNSLAVGEYVLVVKATNVSGNSNGTFKLVVKAKAPSNFVYEPDNSKTDYETAGTSTVPSGNNGGIDVKFYLVGNLPAGITIDSLTGKISYDATVPTGLYPITVKVKNKAGETTTNYTLTVNPIGPKNYTYKPSTDSVYYGTTKTSVAPTGDNGGETVKYRLTGDVPSGVSIDSLTGVIKTYGSVNAGTYPISVEVYNEKGKTTIPYTIVAVGVKPKDLAYGTSNEITAPYNSNVSSSVPTVNKGGLDVKYSLDGNQPNGVVVDSLTGVVTYIKTLAPGVYTFNVIVKNDKGTYSIPFTITITAIAPFDFSYVPAMLAGKFRDTLHSVAPTVNNGGETIHFKLTGKVPQGVTIDSITGIIHTDENVVSGTHEFTVIAYSKIGSASTTFEIVIVSDEAVIPNGFSPNGDGLNDNFVLVGLEKEAFTLSVYNRWGNLVYEKQNYLSDWGGETNKALGLTEADGILPDGTYYYIANFYTNRKAVTGYVYINRTK